MPQESNLGMDGGYDRWGMDLFAIVERDADGATLSRDNFRHGRADADLAAESTCSLLHGIRHGTHPAFCEGPSTEVPVAHTADRMMQHDVRGSGLVGAGPGSDYRVTRESRFHLFRLEPVTEEIGGAHGEKAGHIGHPAHIQTAQVPGRAKLLQQITWALGTQPRR